MNTIIFDVDNTLCDIGPIVHLLAEDNWDAFHEASLSCEPKKPVADSARFAYDVGYVVAIVTARTEDERLITQQWLLNRGIRHHFLFMKAPGDDRSSADYKRKVLATLRADGFVIDAAWDDDPSVCAMYEEEGVPEVIMVPGFSEALETIKKARG